MKIVVKSTKTISFDENSDEDDSSADHNDDNGDLSDELSQKSNQIGNKSTAKKQLQQDTASSPDVGQMTNHGDQHSKVGQRTAAI